MDLSPTEWAYAAGFIDGDGCINTYHTRGRNGTYHYYPRISASQKSRPVLQWLQEKLGGSISTRSSKNNPLSQTETYVWRSSQSAHVWAILRGLLPYLIVKREAALEVLALETEKHQVNQFRQRSQY